MMNIITMIKLICSSFKSAPDLPSWGQKGFFVETFHFLPLPPETMLVQNFRISQLIGILFVLLVNELILLARIEVFTPGQPCQVSGSFVFLK